MRMLAVEDDESRCQWFRWRAWKWSLDLDLTCSPVEAKRLMVEREYGLVFLDHDLSFIYDGPSEAVRKKYIGRKLSKMHSQNPIQYIHC